MAEAARYIVGIMSMTLRDWRRRVTAMDADVRAGADADPVEALTRFRAARDRLFREHPDSPIQPNERADFDGLPYWPSDASLRFTALEAVEAVATSNSGNTFALRRIGLVRLPVGDLEVYWIDVHGGGVFVPFRDETTGSHGSASMSLRGGAVTACSTRRYYSTRPAASSV